MTLQEYLSKANISKGAFQKKHHIPHPYVYRWINGAIPSPDWMKKIKEITKGRVKADSFYQEQN